MRAARPDDRDETQEQRDDRNLIELLQELRVAGLGVQVLFGFLLALPFTTRFVQLSHAQRGLYVGDPGDIGAGHRAAARPGRLPPAGVPGSGRRSTWSRPRTRWPSAASPPSRLAIAGTVWLVVSYVIKGDGAYVIGGFVAVVFAVLWFAFPLLRRAQAERRS